MVLKFYEIADQARVERDADETLTIFRDGSFIQDGFTITRVDLCLYNEKVDANLGVYCLITCIVYTDKGTIEMTYDEGFRGDDSLGRAGKFLTANLGVSAVVTRSIIALKANLDNAKS